MEIVEALEAAGIVDEMDVETGGDPVERDLQDCQDCD